MTKQHKTSSEEIKEYSHSVCSASSIALCTITRANRVNLRSEHSVRMNVGFDQSGDTEGATLRQTTESSDKIRHETEAMKIEGVIQWKSFPLQKQHVKNGLCI